jgi:hypothetical protein
LLPERTKLASSQKQIPLANSPSDNLSSPQKLPPVEHRKKILGEMLNTRKLASPESAGDNSAQQMFQLYQNV